MPRGLLSPIPEYLLPGVWPDPDSHCADKAFSAHMSRTLFYFKIGSEDLSLSKTHKSDPNNLWSGGFKFIDPDTGPRLENKTMFWTYVSGYIRPDTQSCHAKILSLLSANLMEYYVGGYWTLAILHPRPSSEIWINEICRSAWFGKIREKFD